MPQRILISDSSSASAEHLQTILAREGLDPETVRDLTDLPAGLAGILRLAQWAVDDAEFEDAATWFGAARVLDPGSAWLAFCQGVCLEELGMAGPARRALDDALRLEPGLVVAEVRLALLDVKEGEHNEALDRLTRVAIHRGELKAIIEDHDGFEPLHDHPRFHYLVGWA